MSFALDTHGLRPWAAFFRRFAATNEHCVSVFNARVGYDTDSYGTLKLCTDTNLSVHSSACNLDLVVYNPRKQNPSFILW